MSITYYCDTARKITYTLWDGEVDPGQWIAHVHTALEDPAWSASHIWINDLVTVSEGSSIDMSTITQAVALYIKREKELRNGRIAIIANGNYEKASKFSAYMNKIHVGVNVFANLPVACTYLGLNLADVSQVFGRLRADLHENEVSGVAAGRR